MVVKCSPKILVWDFPGQGHLHLECEVIDAAIHGHREAQTQRHCRIQARDGDGDFTNTACHSSYIDIFCI